MNHTKRFRTWTVAEAKAFLSDILRLAEEEGPQHIGADRAFVIVPAATWYARITAPKIKVSIEARDALTVRTNSCSIIV